MDSRTDRRWGRWQALPLRWQMTVLVAGLIVATLAGLGLFLDLRLSVYLQASSAAYLHQLADPYIAGETHLAPLRRADPERTAAFVLSRLTYDLAAEIDGPESFALVATSDGTLVPLPAGPGQRPMLPISTPPVDTGELVQAANGGHEVRLVTTDAGRRYLVLLVPIAVNGQTIGVAILGDSLARSDALLQTFRLTLLVGTIVAALAAGLAARGLIAAALRPLGGVVAATRRVAAGDWNVRVGCDAPPNELGQLARSFDQMVERLQEVFEAQRRFVADASHELRTPLTAIGGMLEMLEINADRGDPSTRQRIQVATTREVERLGHLVDDLLTLSRVERDGPARELVTLDTAVSELRPTLEALTQGHDLQLRLARVPPVLGQQTRLEQVVVNLVENASKYTPPGGRITVDVGEESGQVVLQVSDTGVGIRPEVLPRIFERFFRADTSRARATGGFGLGLAIVQAIVTAHRGTVEVASQPGEGTTFVVRLPAAIVETS
jgi:two-component system, OmpR family, sensor kinase